MSMTTNEIDPQTHDTKLAALYFDLDKTRRTESYQRDSHRFETEQDEEDARTRERVTALAVAASPETLCECGHPKRQHSGLERCKYWDRTAFGSCGCPMFR